MGCQENAVKGLVPDEVFKVERAGKELVQGTDCFERSILPKKKMRESLADCGEKGWSKKNLKMAIQVIEAEKNNSRCKAIANLLKKLHEHSSQFHNESDVARMLEQSTGRKTVLLLNTKKILFVVVVVVVQDIFHYWTLSIGKSILGIRIIKNTGKV